MKAHPVSAVRSIHDCFAVVTPGFEDVVARELAGIDITEAEVQPGGVAFSARDAQLVAANLHLRAASRVLVRAASFTAKSFAELERRARTVPWASYVRSNAPVAFRVTCRKSRLYHSDAVAERLAKAVAAKVAGARVLEPHGGARPDAADGPDDADEPTDDGAETRAQLFVVRFEHDRCTISADASGDLLHRRGYRKATAKAPVRETIAAGALLALRYDGTLPLIDPMCGAGTFAIEAALIARNIAPGAGRSFACEAWPGFDRAAAAGVRAAAAAAERPSAAAPIVASDRDAGAITAARANAARAGVLADIAFAERALSAVASPPGVGLLVTNPPYGLRVGEARALRNLYAQIGNVARERLPGWRVALVSADRTLEVQAKLAFEEVLRFSNGGIKVRLVATPPG